MSRRAAPPSPNPLDRKTLESAMTADLTPSPTSRPARGGPALLIGLAALLAASIASAHVTVSPKRSAPGERETYVIRAPNERRTATVRIEGEFPPEVKVTSFEAKPGWTIEPKRNADGAIVVVTELVPGGPAERSGQVTPTPPPPPPLVEHARGSKAPRGVCATRASATRPLTAKPARGGRGGATSCHETGGIAGRWAGARVAGEMAGGRMRAPCVRASVR